MTPAISGIVTVGVGSSGTPGPPALSSLFVSAIMVTCFGGADLLEQFFDPLGVLASRVFLGGF